MKIMRPHAAGKNLVQAGEEKQVMQRPYVVNYSYA